MKPRTGLNSRDRSFGALLGIVRRKVGAGTELLAAGSTFAHVVFGAALARLPRILLCVLDLLGAAAGLEDPPRFGLLCSGTGGLGFGSPVR